MKQYPFNGGQKRKYVLYILITSFIVTFKKSNTFTNFFYVF